MAASRVADPAIFGTRPARRGVTNIKSSPDSAPDIKIAPVPAPGVFKHGSDSSTLDASYVFMNLTTKINNIA